jgi:hypothetical protein
MKRADQAFAVYIAGLALVVAVMTAAEVSRVVAAGSAPLAARPSDRVAAITDRGAGPVVPSRVAGAFDWR